MCLSLPIIDMNCPPQNAFRKTERQAADIWDHVAEMMHDMETTLGEIYDQDCWAGLSIKDWGNPSDATPTQDA